MEKINIAKILKNVPEGTELYCSIFGYVKFIRVKDTGYANMIHVDVPIKGIEFFYEDGRYNKYYSDSECVLFPSRENRDWSKFHLEKLIKPKFKVGDKIRLKENHNYIYTITGIREEENKYECGVTFVLRFSEQENWELVPNKFDINTLKPFDKVFVRDSDKDMWCASIFSHTCKDKYFCVDTWHNQCIPYKGNEHLLGKKDGCDEYYKTWK